MIFFLYLSSLFTIFFFRPSKCFLVFINHFIIFFTMILRLLTRSIWIRTLFRLWNKLYLLRFSFLLLFLLLFLLILFSFGYCFNRGSFLIFIFFCLLFLFLLINFGFLLFCSLQFLSKLGFLNKLYLFLLFHFLLLIIYRFFKSRIKLFESFICILNQFQGFWLCRLFYLFFDIIHQFLFEFFLTLTHNFFFNDYNIIIFNYFSIF